MQLNNIAPVAMFLLVRRDFNKYKSRGIFVKVKRDFLLGEERFSWWYSGFFLVKKVEGEKGDFEKEVGILCVSLHNSLMQGA